MLSRVPEIKEVPPLSAEAHAHLDNIVASFDPSAAMKARRVAPPRCPSCPARAHPAWSSPVAPAAKRTCSPRAHR